MIRLIVLLILMLMANLAPTFAQTSKRSFNKVLADSLHNMVKTDQIAANFRQGRFLELPPEAWQQFKDSVFGTHQQILDKMFQQYGYPGYDLVGKDGEHDFWLMVQHCDKKPDFQDKILTAMQLEVKRNNADPKNYAYLIDRVRLNTGRKQVYGTQVMYRRDICQAIPKPLEDSATVNVRRKSVGLEYVEAYLNTMTTAHFEMNKANMEERGIKGPTLHVVPKD